MYVKRSVSSLGEFQSVVSDIKLWIKSGLLIQINIDDQAQNILNIKDEGPYPDFVEAEFSDTVGLYYRLSVDLYHGGGGTWSVIEG
jgi:hypothetical protein